MTGHRENELFFNCQFDKVNDLVLKDCDLNQSRFTTSSVKDVLGLTMTLNCHSFQNVEFSELLFDLFMILAYKSKGNDEKREKLLDVIGRGRAAALLKVLNQIE